jgi:hypothetical protein
MAPYWRRNGFVLTPYWLRIDAVLASSGRGERGNVAGKLQTAEYGFETGIQGGASCPHSCIIRANILIRGWRRPNQLISSKPTISPAENQLLPATRKWVILPQITVTPGDFGTLRRRQESRESGARRVSGTNSCRHERCHSTQILSTVQVVSWRNAREGAPRRGRRAGRNRADRNSPAGGRRFPIAIISKDIANAAGRTGRRESFGCIT